MRLEQASAFGVMRIDDCARVVEFDEKPSDRPYWRDVGTIDAYGEANMDLTQQHCVLPNGLKVGVYPAEDRARFAVTERSVTLVTPEMLGQTVHARA